MNRDDALCELVVSAENIIELLDRWELVRQNSSAHRRLKNAISTLRNSRIHSDLFVQDEKVDQNDQADWPVTTVLDPAISENYTLKKPSLAVDAIVIKDGSYLLIKRKNPPYGWALPGGFVDYGEKVEDALVRELREETSLEAFRSTFFQVVSDPKRDPRFHTVSLVYEVSLHFGEAKAADDAKEVGWFSFEEITKMEIAFDHKDILKAHYDAKSKYHLKQDGRPI